MRSLDELSAELQWLADGGFEPATALLRARDAANEPPVTTDSTLAALRAEASIHGQGGRAALPEGTQRRVFKEEKPGTASWEEVQVPPTPKSARADQRLVSISELPDHAQLAFKGVESLNQLQVHAAGLPGWLVDP